MKTLPLTHCETGRSHLSLSQLPPHHLPQGCCRVKGDNGQENTFKVATLSLVIVLLLTMKLLAELNGEFLTNRDPPAPRNEDGIAPGRSFCWQRLVGKVNHSDIKSMDHLLLSPFLLQAVGTCSHPAGWRAWAYESNCVPVDKSLSLQNFHRIPPLNYSDPSPRTSPPIYHMRFLCRWSVIIS